MYLAIGVVLFLGNPTGRVDKRRGLFFNTLRLALSVLPVQCLRNRALERRISIFCNLFLRRRNRILGARLRKPSLLIKYSRLRLERRATQSLGLSATKPV